jgi:hypothetical protein
MQKSVPPIATAMPNNVRRPARPAVARGARLQILDGERRVEEVVLGLDAATPILWR